LETALIIITIELWSAITKKRTKLAEMHIANDGTGTATVGSYDGKVLRAPNFHPEVNVTRRGRVENYPRQAVTVWNLLARMLKEMKYK
jgi:hypothetical protein